MINFQFFISFFLLFFSQYESFLNCCHERDILVEFYKTTSEIDWFNSKGWLQAHSHHCSWYGVACDESENVIKLKLIQNNLKGTIPSVLGELKFLEELNLSSNQLRGTLTRKLSFLNNLKVLNISSNSFDTFEEGFSFQENGGCSLEVFTMKDNLLKEIPSFEECSPTLKQIVLSGNKLKYIPQEFGNLSLSIFDVSDNLLDPLGIQPICKIETTLKHLDISLNKIDSLPTQFFDLINLEYLNLNSNSLEVLPTLIINLGKLETLYLRNNDFTTLPLSFSGLTNLKTLDLRETPVESLPPMDLNLVTLLRVSLTNIEVLDISNFTSLKFITLSVPKLIPSSLENVTTLQYFFVEGASDFTFPNLPPLINQFYYLNVTFDEWPIFYYENQFTNLERVGGTSIRGSSKFPYWFANAPNLKYFQSIRTQGTFPTEIGILSQLEELIIVTSPDFFGTIPTELGKLTKLKVLNLQFLNLTGKIPTELSLLTNLEELSIDLTEVDRVIPKELLVLNKVPRCSFGTNMTCFTDNIMGESICGTECEGDSLVGFWMNDDRKCKPMITGFDLVKWEKSSLEIFSSNQFKSVIQLASDCQETSSMTFSESGTFELVSQETNDEGIYMLNITFTIESRMMVMKSQLIKKLWDTFCDEPNPEIGEVVDISYSRCQFIGTPFVLLPLSDCNKIESFIEVDLKNGVMKSFEIPLLFSGCSGLDSDIMEFTLRKGWSCVENQLWYSCTPLCGED